ncbi:OmpA family protein [Desulfuromusa kysingii]|uniref:OmpA family protein n=1 Tax=Desulfuromusa kysingii TaxID=37625 RepID=A0A1H4D6M0_9BACT|nr:OmpA family protein [Desulfuromusa kysingii]SEA68385.1 OmpA family protein [Desulfuromusa kysingii]
MRRRSSYTYESEEGNYILSVSDLMSGLLFIFIITLVFFVIKYKSINKSLASRDQIRTEILHTVDEKIQDMNIEKNLDVYVDTKNGIITLRDKKDKMFFRSGMAQPEENGIMAIESLSDIFAGILPCYTSQADLCQLEMLPPLEERTLESVYIEGHTDIVPVGPACKYEDNWDLSANRAIKTYQILTKKNSILEDLTNQSGQKIFSVAGYAGTRSLSSGDSPKERALDRRIDFRLVMSPPDKLSSEIEQQFQAR